MKKILKLSLASLALVSPITTSADLEKNTKVFSKYLNEKQSYIKQFVSERKYDKFSIELDNLKKDMDTFNLTLQELDTKIYDVVKKTQSSILGMSFAILALEIEKLEKELEKILKKKAKKIKSKEVISKTKIIIDSLKNFKSRIQYYIDITGNIITARNFTDYIRALSQVDDELKELGIKDFWFNTDKENKTLFLTVDNENIIAEMELEKLIEIEGKINDLYKDFRKKADVIKEDLGDKLVSDMKNTTKYDFSKTFTPSFERVSLL